MDQVDLSTNPIIVRKLACAKEYKKFYKEALKKTIEKSALLFFVQDPFKRESLRGQIERAIKDSDHFRLIAGKLIREVMNLLPA